MRIDYDQYKQLVLDIDENTMKALDERKPTAFIELILFVIGFILGLATGVVW